MEDAATMPDAPELPDDPAALKALVIAGRIEKADLAEEVARLRAIVAAFQRAAFGRRSETLEPDQLQLDLELALEEALQELTETRADEDAADATRKASRTERRRVNRGALPAHLPRVEIVVEPDETSCPCCGGALHVIGEDRAERLDVVPAQYRMLVTRRPKYACRACSDGVVQAPAPPRLIPGGLPTEALVAEVLTAKYTDHAPLHRQAQAMARQGLSIDRSTLGDWVGCAARELRPVHARLVEILKASPETLRRRDHGAGARPRTRQDQDGLAVGAGAGRPALGRRRSARRRLPLRRGPRRRGRRKASRGLRRRAASRPMRRASRRWSGWSANRRWSWPSSKGGSSADPRRQARLHP